MHSTENANFLNGFNSFWQWVFCFVVMSERLKGFVTEMKTIKGKKNKKGITMKKDGLILCAQWQAEKNLIEEQNLKLYQ